ncbi:MAG: hypothetical protein Ct9H300mP7_7090 [Verrucomicrobiota bacterium]|nr:MAG: hypothetical protein Ct9H300mP7_7090 [Verrucomicrobiota bacterium]
MGIIEELEWRDSSPTARIGRRLHSAWPRDRDVYAGSIPRLIACTLGTWCRCWRCAASSSLATSRSLLPVAQPARSVILAAKVPSDSYSPTSS